MTAFGPGPGGRDFLTNAYDAATGEEIWGSAYGNDRGGADYLTVAFDSGTGSKVWAERYGPRDAGAAALIAGPTGSSVFVTGDMWDRKFQSHITTVAYAA